MVDLNDIADLYIPPPIDDIPDVDEDKPVGGEQPPIVGEHRIPYLIFGSGTFANQYNPDTLLNSDTPLRTVRLALRYGMCAFDTSPYYGSSESILGAILRSLADIFPRTSYQLMTKAGRYGLNRSSFDYSPETVRASVLRSLSRLGTDHLDVVYMHDVEYVATQVPGGSNAGNHLKCLKNPGVWGLAQGEEARIWGDGDQQVLEAVRELWKLKLEGKIKAVGITGYPLPTLLRLASLVLHNPPYKPLDIILSYSHYTLQNGIFSAYVSEFKHRAKVGQLVAASPLSMGLLTSNPPAWHPAPAELISAKDQAIKACEGWDGGLPNLALGFHLRDREGEMKDTPRAIGLSTVWEVHEAIKAWRQVKNGDNEKRQACEEFVMKIFRDAGYEGYSWQSPPL